MSNNLQRNIVGSPPRTPRRPLAPAEGYNLVAADYDAWHWGRFWDANELPEVMSLLGGVKSRVPKGTFLDAGCGTGRYRSFIQALRYHYLGVDVSVRMIDINARKAKKNQPRASFIVADIGCLPLQSEAVDAMLCSRVLSHVEDVSGPLREFQRVLRQGGACILTDVHSDHPYQYTAVPTDHGKVAIDTFKHSPQLIFKAVRQFQDLQIVSYKDYRLSDLRERPPKEGFEKVYSSPERPIFWTCLIQKGCLPL